MTGYCLRTSLTALALPVDDPRYGPTQLAVDLSWTDTNPLAVTLIAYGPNPVVWVFARDLLHDGLLSEAGVHEVFARPCAADRSCVEVELLSPSGHCVLRLNRDAVQKFLWRSFMQVPRGEEPSWCPDFPPAELTAGEEA